MFVGLPDSNKQAKVKIIKKVRFDLNVRAYEPIPPADTSPSLSENDEEGNKGKGDGETVDSGIAIAETHSIGSVSGAQGQPLNHRYQNCIDSYDEDDELVYQDLDFDEEIESDDGLDYFDDQGDGSGFDDSRTSKDMGQARFSNLPPKLEEQAPLIHLTGNTVQELKMHSSDENARYRSKYIHPVLTPVENVVQWKKIKAKDALPSVKQLKENQNIESEHKTRLPLSSELNSKCFKAVGADVTVNTSRFEATGCKLRHVEDDRTSTRSY